MEITFYISAVIAVLATARVVTHAHPVRALLYLVVSFLAIAVVMYTLGAPFAAALEVIVYAGAIVVLFVFVIMMMQVDATTVARERSWLAPRAWLGPGVLAAVLLAAMIHALWPGGGAMITANPQNAESVGAVLFGPYLLIVELASFLLLAALITAVHVGREQRRGKH